MIYRVMQDIPGRLRLRCGAALFTTAEAYGVAAALRQIEGVDNAQVRSANGSVLIEYDPAHSVVHDQALALVNGLDMYDLPVAEADANEDMAHENNEFARALVIAVGGYITRRFLMPPPFATAFTLIRAAGFILKGLRDLLSGKLTVEVLDATAITVSLLQRQFAQAGGIMFLLSISDMMQQHVNARTRIALENSLLVRGDTVWVVDDDGSEREHRLETVQIGQLIRIRTGFSVPVDATVVEGEGEVNEASMTGESILVHKREGSTLFAGTAVEDGSMIVRVNALPGHTRIDRIVALVQESSELKASAQSRAERLADRLVPFNLFAFVAMLALTGGNLVRASSTLMVDYSCAIKLSTPVAVMSAMREASNRGAVVKGGKYLEALDAADVVVFDKTGTLTEASPQVEKIICMDGENEDHVLKIAACLEEHFPHSLARAIVRAASDAGLHHEKELHTEVEYVVAHGIASTVGGKSARIGSAHFIFEDEGTPCPEGLFERLEAEAPASSTVFLAIDGTLRGVLCITDPLRSEAADAVAQLRASGIQKVVMLTGDAELCARQIAKQVGIDEYHAQVLPEDKASYVERLKEEGHTVIMVGDGINDSPALASANVSVALSDASDVARAVADVTVLDASLESLVMLRRLSRGLMKRIHSDYQFIVGFNTTLIALGVAGVLTPAITSTLHNLSTVGVTAHNTTSLLPAASLPESDAEIF